MGYIEFAKQSVPDAAYLCSFFVMCAVIISAVFTVRDKTKMKGAVLWALLCEYLFLIVCSTILIRTPKDDDVYELVPFWNYHDIFLQKDPMDLWEVVLNILLFVPVGVLLTAIGSIGDKGGGRSHRYKWYFIAAYSTLISFFIEITQLITKRGLCETDDLIHNTLGCMIGYGLFGIFRKRICNIMKLTNR